MMGIRIQKKTIWNVFMNIVTTIGLIFLASKTSFGFVLFLMGFLLGVPVGIIVLSRFFEFSKKKPYVYECPEEDCNFRIATDFSPVVVLDVGERHKQAFHGGL